jgi:hypothetical protein
MFSRVVTFAIVVALFELTASAFQRPRIPIVWDPPELSQRSRRITTTASL